MYPLWTVFQVLSIQIIYYFLRNSTTPYHIHWFLDKLIRKPSDDFSKTPKQVYKKIITMGAIKALQKSTSWLNIDYYAFSTFSSSCSCTLEYSSVVRWILRDRQPNEIYLILVPRGLQYPLWSLVVWEYSEVGSGEKAVVLCSSYQARINCFDACILIFEINTSKLVKFVLTRRCILEFAKRWIEVTR